ncbi:hypothetical protein [Natrinema sp. CBA1119]|uniref:DUF7282 domain-containing protein n=1 Tax=Natrinema sp. CBA1119 TaxID=1608465 RepID=UPI0026D87CC8
MRRSNDEIGAFTATMNARNQLLVVLTALMLVCSSGAMVTAATSGDTIDQSSEASANEYDSANETTNETVDDEQDETATGIDGNETVPDDGDADNETADTDNDSQPAYVTFDDQTTDGETVVVENVTIASPGFVTIHDSSLLVGEVFESVIGTSEYLEAGTHEQVEVTLDEPLEEDETLIAMPHRDTNDNQTYDFVESEGQFDGPFLTADDEPVTDDAVVTVEDATDEEPVEDTETDEDVQQPDDNVTDEEPTDNVTDEPVDDNETDDGLVDDNETDDDGLADDNETDDELVDDETDEPIDDNETDEPIDDNETDEPIDDNVTDEDEGADEEPVDEMPMEDLPVDGDGQPIFVTVENPTIENLNIENVTVYVLVVGEDVDGDEIADQINNVTDGEMPVDDDETEDNVTDDNESDENITQIDEEPIDDETEDNVTEDNETEDDLTPIDDNETEDNETEDNLTPIDEEPIDDNETEDDAADVAAAESFNVSDLEAPSSATIGENITVTANVSNPTDEERTEAIQFRLDGDLVAEQNVTLESGASEDVEFEVDTTGLATGDYVHMVLSDESGEVAALELTEETEETDTGIDDETNESETEDTGLDNETNETEDGLNDTGENTTDGVTAD